MTKISEAIKDDHRELEQAYKNILGAQTSDEKIRWRNQFTWELARHSIGEELVVYPQFEKLLPLGREMADHDRQEHLKVKKHLYTFQDLHPDDVDFESTLQALWTDLSQHIKEEEEHDLVALEEKLDASDSESMVSSFKRTKMFIPTRSHPSAPDKPPFETVAGLLSAPIDHLRDIFRKFPKESKSQLPP
ncbi:HHE domain protein [Nemania serpens]|nr:HHE domain protein [Nemania serpens]